MEQLYKNIIHLRKNNKLSIKQLAGYLNILEDEYIIYELGRKKIPINILESIADLYRISLSGLLYKQVQTKEIDMSRLEINDLKELGRFNRIVMTYEKIKYRGVEQMVARKAHNLKVEGSIPSPATSRLEVAHLG